MVLNHLNQAVYIHDGTFARNSAFAAIEIASRVEDGNANKSGHVCVRECVMCVSSCQRCIVSVESNRVAGGKIHDHTWDFEWKWGRGGERCDTWPHRMMMTHRRCSVARDRRPTSATAVAPWWQTAGPSLPSLRHNNYRTQQNSNFLLSTSRTEQNE